MDVEGDLIAGCIAAVAHDLDITFLFDSRVSPRRSLAPEFDFDNVGFEIVEHEISVNNLLQLFALNHNNTQKRFLYPSYMNLVQNPRLSLYCFSKKLLFDF